MPPLLIVPIGVHNIPASPTLASRLQSVFQVDVSIAPAGMVDPDAAFDISRRQYDSNRLILSLTEAFPRLTGKLLGITSLDLYVPGFTHVVGHAQFDGRCATVSSFRLKQAVYGFPENLQLVEERLHKEAIHQLGHAHGLFNCESYTCVMHPSTAVERIDVRSIDFCAECGRLLKGRLDGGSPLPRGIA